MATYLELHSLASNSDLQDKVEVAVIKKAQALIDAGNLTANAKAWCEEVLANPRSKGTDILYYVLAANSDAAVSAIQDATDSAIQTNVNTAVDALIA